MLKVIDFLYSEWSLRGEQKASRRFFGPSVIAVDFVSVGTPSASTAVLRDRRSANRCCADPGGSAATKRGPSRGLASDGVPSSSNSTATAWQLHGNGVATGW